MPPSERNQTEANPAALLVRAKYHRKTLFSLGEKEIRRAQNEKSKEYFSVVRRVVASGGGAGQFFRSKKVRAKCIITAPKLTCSELTAPRGLTPALRRAKSAFVFAVKSQSSPQQQYERAQTKISMCSLRSEINRGGRQASDVC